MQTNTDDSPLHIEFSRLCALRSLQRRLAERIDHDLCRQIVGLLDPFNFALAVPIGWYFAYDVDRGGVLFVRFSHDRMLHPTVLPQYANAFCTAAHATTGIDYVALVSPSATLQCSRQPDGRWIGSFQEPFNINSGEPNA
jgi:hypothetical protein